MFRFLTTIFFSLAIISGQAAASDVISAGLKRCVDISDDAARLDCFDALAATKPPPDETPAEKVATEFSALVTRCEESDATGRTFFYLENGQVWKQQNSGRLRYKKCAFEVTISKDAFGYRMQIPSKSRRIRVSRVR